MKLLAAFVLAALTTLAGDLSGVKTVYLLPMSAGLDQYLAVRLAANGAFQVSTDPALADAIFTDRIGSNFEKTLEDLNAPKKATAAVSKISKDGSTDEDQDAFSKPTMQPLSRGKGSLFLVDRKTHVVLWSMYAKPKSSQSDDMNALATQITSQITKDRKSK
ncbi:MAG TPA: hypothetical protein VGN17_25315 [Bryobacteraceae bacterium]|jgi:hypothetical protein